MGECADDRNLSAQMPPCPCCWAVAAPFSVLGHLLPELSFQIARRSESSAQAPTSCCTRSPGAQTAGGQKLWHAQDQLASLRDPRFPCLVGVNSPLKVNSLGRGDVLRENIGNPVFLAVPDSPLWSMSSLAVVRCYGS